MLVTSKIKNNQVLSVNKSMDDQPLIHCSYIWEANYLNLITLITEVINTCVYMDYGVMHLV